jgi:hypothetical protein
MKHLKKFNEGIFSSSKSDDKLEEIYDKISDAAYSVRTFGAFTKQASFVNGAKWAIHNLTQEEIDYIKKNGSDEEHSFLGM